ncbi:hypothetical protein N0V82_005622 [Gnomoniopsis sp. IMI 355080]|nr:hypothetical protein N0V82_005622 [Gnomoniopsis sp. IMI 355080]
MNDLPNPSIIRLLNVTKVNPSTPNAWLVLEHANKGTLRDLLAHARGAEGSTSRKVPASFCFHILAGILNAIIDIQETHGLQHIDLHAGNVVFHRSSDQWPPVVKVIDFGKMVQLPEESRDDIAWDEASSPSIGPLARSLLSQTSVLEDDFLSATRDLGKQMSPLQALRTAREDSRMRAEAVVESVPKWLLAYFGHDVVECSPEDDAQRNIQGDEQIDDDDDDDDEPNDLITIRLKVNILWP